MVINRLGIINNELNKCNIVDKIVYWICVIGKL